MTLYEVVAFDYMRESVIQRQLLTVEDGIGGPDRGGVMRVACCGHGKAAQLGITKRERVVAAQSGRGVEDLQRIDRQSFECGEANAGAEQIVGMWRYGEATVFVNQRTDIARGASLQPRPLRQRRPDATQMTFGGGDFNSRNNEETIHWQSILAH